jgi:hypothetical protein
MGNCCNSNPSLFTFKILNSSGLLFKKNTRCNLLITKEGIRINNKNTRLLFEWNEIVSYYFENISFILNIRRDEKIYKLSFIIEEYENLIYHMNSYRKHINKNSGQAFEVKTVSDDGAPSEKFDKDSIIGAFSGRDGKNNLENSDKTSRKHSKGKAHGYTIEGSSIQIVDDNDIHDIKNININFDNEYKNTLENIKNKKTENLRIYSNKGILKRKRRNSKTKGMKNNHHEHSIKIPISKIQDNVESSYGNSEANSSPAHSPSPSMFMNHKRPLETIPQSKNSSADTSTATNSTPGMGLSTNTSGNTTGTGNSERSFNRTSQKGRKENEKYVEYERLAGPAMTETFSPKVSPHTNRSHTISPVSHPKTKPIRGTPEHEVIDQMNDQLYRDNQNQNDIEENPPVRFVGEKVHVKFSENPFETRMDTLDTLDTIRTKSPVDE